MFAFVCWFLHLCVLASWLMVFVLFVFFIICIVCLLLHFFCIVWHCVCLHVFLFSMFYLLFSVCIVCILYIYIYVRILYAFCASLFLFVPSCASCFYLLLFVFICFYVLLSICRIRSLSTKPWAVALDFRGFLVLQGIQMYTMQCERLMERSRAVGL